MSRSGRGLPGAELDPDLDDARAQRNRHRQQPEARQQALDRRIVRQHRGVQGPHPFGVCPGERGDDQPPAEAVTAQLVGDRDGDLRAGLPVRFDADMADDPARTGRGPKDGDEALAMGVIRTAEIRRLAIADAGCGSEEAGPPALVREAGVEGAEPVVVRPGDPPDPDVMLGNVISWVRPG